MKILQMREIGVPERVVSIIADDENYERVQRGAYGTVCPVVGERQRVAKRIEVNPPRSVSDIGQFTAHVTRAKSLLLRYRKAADGYSEPLRSTIITSIDEILINSLSSHWSCETDQSNRFFAVWFLQQRATGKTLEEHFRDSIPVDLYKRVGSRSATDC